MRKVLIPLLILICAAAGFWWWQSRAASTGPKLLESDTVRLGTVYEVLEATGIVKTQVGAEVKIGARATGTITEMLVRVGDPVTKGDLIAVIDDRETRSQLREAEARLARSRSELERVEKVFPLQIREAKASLESVRARAKYLLTFLRRQRELLAKKLVPPDDVDDALQQWQVAESDVAAKAASLERVRTEFIREQAKALRTIDEAQAAIDSLQVRLSYTRILTPITGVVSLVTAQEGETVVAGLQVANLITVVDPSLLEMWIYVDETDVGRVRPGQTVEFRVDAYPDRVFSGTVAQIYPQPEIRDNIVYYQALVTLTRETAADLRPEMTTQCTILVQERNNVLTLPNTALKWVDGEQVVFVRRPGSAEIRRVQPVLGLNGRDRSEILEGLSEGDEVGTRVTLGTEGS